MANRFIKCKVCGQVPTATEGYGENTLIEVRFYCSCGQVGETINLEKILKHRKKKIIKDWNEKQV